MIMKPRKRFPIWIAFALLAFVPSCGTLDPAGAYKSDKVLYDADAVIVSSYDVIRSFVVFDAQQGANAAPNMRMAANRIRLTAPQAFQSAIAVRDAYAAAPNSSNSTALAKALAVLRAASIEATRWLVQTNFSNLNP